MFMKINYKIFVSVAAIALVAAGCNKASTTPNITPPVSPATTVPESTTTPPVSLQNVVTYSDAGFSPASLTVKKGDTVVFKNTASDGVHVASNPHPTHDGYPTTGGCVSSTFDSCATTEPGQSWSFKFDIVGSWGYHNHLNPSERGTIVVQ